MRTKGSKGKEILTLSNDENEPADLFDLVRAISIQSPSTDQNKPLTYLGCRAWSRGLRI